MKHIILMAIGFSILACTTVPNALLSEDSVMPVNHGVYQEECSACHFAYQPGLLPERSWQVLLSTASLQNHFGDNAELEVTAQASILKYLIENSADKSSYEISQEIVASIDKNETPLRITETEYIREAHGDLKAEHVMNNPDVQSLSNCNACHTEIDKGNFDEDLIIIPNFGKWDD